MRYVMVRIEKSTPLSCLRLTQYNIVLLLCRRDTCNCTPVQYRALHALFNSTMRSKLLFHTMQPRLCKSITIVLHTSLLTGTNPLSAWSRRCTSGVRSSTLYRMSYSSFIKVMACSVRPPSVVLPVICGAQSVLLPMLFCGWGVSAFLVCGSGLCPIASISLSTPRFTMASA